MNELNLDRIPQDSLARSSGASLQLKPKSRKTPHTLLKKQNRNYQPSGNELIMEECDNTVVIREHDVAPLPNFSFRKRNIPTDLDTIESSLDISPDILQQNADIVDRDQYETFSNIEYDSDLELIPHARPEKKNSLHIDLRIECASNMIQNLSCFENSQPERKNSNEFDWQKYMLKEYDEIKPNELEQNLDVQEDKALNLRNETDELSFIDPNK
ncbi:hypothetical protein TNCV_1396521 [Trichonephila clavipes]|nr:hypothetical protein TNCV_1396521 [Trichonephila clavipes]